MKPKFDGYAAQYDAWFMENDNLFQSELRLFQRALGDISGQRVLSVGCGSGLFESMIDHSGIEVCHPDDTGKFSDKTYASLIKLTAWLCEQLHLDGQDLIRHYDVTGKLCPLYYVEHEDAWTQLKNDEIGRAHV